MQTYLLEITYGVVILCATVAGIIGIGAAVRGLWRFIRCSRIANKRRVCLLNADGTVGDYIKPGEFRQYRYHDGEWYRLDTKTAPNRGEDAPRSTSGAPYGSPVDESGRPVSLAELRRILSDYARVEHRHDHEAEARLDADEPPNTFKSYSPTEPFSDDLMDKIADRLPDDPA